MALFLLAFRVLALLPDRSLDYNTKSAFRNIYEFRCADLFLNPIYITSDQSNTLIYKPATVHCVMLMAMKASLKKEKNENRRKELQEMIVRIKKMTKIFFEAYQFAVPGLLMSDAIKQTQQLRMSEMKKTS